MRSVVVLAICMGCGFSAHGNGGTDGGSVDTPAPSDGSPGSDGPLADASTPDAMPPPSATCGAPQAMPDDFYTATDWIEQNMSAIGSTVTLYGYDSNAYVYALPAVSLVSAAATVEVPVTTGSAGATDFFAAWYDGSGYDLLGFEAIGSNVVVGAWSADGSSSTMIVPYGGSAMLYWQIRESAGTVAFATSPDGSAWSAPISTVPTPPWAAYAHLVLETTGPAVYTGTYTALDGSDAGSAMPWCDADTFHGMPGSDSIRSWWSNTTTTNTACTFGGSGYVTATGNNCFFQTSARYNLVDSSLIVHWGSDTDPASGPGVVLVGSASTEYLYYYAGAELCDFPGNHCMAHAFSAAGSDAYWRVREYSANQELEVDTSSDGSSWVPGLLVPEPFVPSAIEIGVGTTRTGSAHVLGVN